MISTATLIAATLMAFLPGEDGTTIRPELTAAAADVSAPSLTAPLAGVSALLATTSELDAFEAASLYGDEIRFDVLRKGKKVGEHVTRFEAEGDELAVSSQMQIKIKLLFVTAFKFNYVSEAWFDAVGMKRIESGTIEGKKRRFNVGAREGYRFGWTNPDGEEQDAALNLLPTDHWNPAVLQRTSVFNTITGRENAVTITPEAWETVDTGSGPRDALRVRYSGELDTVAWYDREGRWVGLAFEGRDGSDIRYVCTKCGGDV